MYGLGHGGFESMVNKALTGLFSAVVLTMAPRIASSGVPGAQASALEAYAKGLSAMSPWQLAAASVALASGLALHSACAVLVLRVFRNGKLKWFAAAIGIHGAYDLSMGAGYLLASNWIIVSLAIAWAIVCIRLVVRMRPEREAGSGEPFASAGAVPIRGAK